MNNLIDLFVKSAYAVTDRTDTSGDVVGTLSVPSGIPADVAKTGDFITAIVRFILIIGGLFTLWQFLSGGLAYISSNGDKGKVSEASNKLSMSLLGLVVMAASFVIIAIISKLLFGSFTAILIPKLQSVN